MTGAASSGDVQHKHTPPHRRANGQRLRGDALGQPLGHNFQRPGVAVRAVGEHVIRLRTALPRGRTGLVEPAVRHHDRPKVRHRLTDAKPVIRLRTVQVTRLAAPDRDQILTVIGRGEGVRAWVARSRVEPERVQRVVVVVLLAGNVLLRVFVGADGEEEVAARADALGREIEGDLFALLRGERDPVALAALGEEPGDLARSGHHRGRFRCTRGCGLHRELVAREVDHHRVGGAARTLQGVRETVLKGGGRIDVGEARQLPDRIRGRRDGNRDLFERGARRR